jgi:hypothetical protein
MTIDRLKLLMPPPPEPLYPGSRKEWSAFQKKIRLRFPEDYFTLVNAYGSGRFLAGEFKVANPFDPDDERFADRELRTLRENKANAPYAVPYPLYPESGGLYPFGIDGNGNTFLWLTEGGPDEWAIACFNSEDYSEVVKLALIEFLVLLATNQLKINRRKFWGSDVSEELLEFRPRRLAARKSKG